MPAENSSSPRVVEEATQSLAGSRWTLDVVRYQPTERPIEDRWSFAYNEDSARLIVGVYDGHGGSSCAERISKVIPQALMDQLPSQHAVVFEDVDAQLTKTFTNDHSFFRLKSTDWVSNAKVAKSGCMALVCDIDMKSMLATISNAGDCRLAVIRLDGDSSSDQRGIVVHETTDLNAKSTSEQERLSKEHPGEDMVVVSGRLFGRLMSTRGFGDVYYKLPRSGLLGKYSHRRYIDVLSATEDPGKVPMNEQYETYFYGYQTPPYITPRPESSTIYLIGDDVIVLASDGLWDVVSTQEVGEVVCGEVEGKAENMANKILQFARDKRPPGDDTTIVVLRCGREVATASVDPRIPIENC